MSPSVTSPRVWWGKQDKQRLRESYHGHSGGGRRQLQDAEGTLLQPPWVEANSLGSVCCNVFDYEIVACEALRLGLEVIAFTNHSRNGDGTQSIQVTADWMHKFLRRNPSWWQQLGISASNYNALAESDKNFLLKICPASATKLLDYGDERLEANWSREANLQSYYPNVWILSGLEVNLKANGQPDTELVHDPRCRIAIASLHPKYDPQAFAALRHDPQLYSQFVLSVDFWPFHIFAHPGEDCYLKGAEESREKAEALFRRELDLEAIGLHLLATQTSFEININDVYNRLVELSGRPDCPTNVQELRLQLRPTFEGLTPFLPDPVAMAKLQLPLQRGLMLIVNTDRHGIPSPANCQLFKLLMDIYLGWLVEQFVANGIGPSMVVNCRWLQWRQRHFVCRQPWS